MDDTSLDVADPGAILRFSDSLIVFANQALEVLQSIDNELRMALSLLAEREARWTREVDARLVAVEYAEDDDREQALNALEDAEESLRELRLRHEEVLTEAQQYWGAEEALKSLLMEDTPEARNALKQQVELLYDYLREPMPDFSGGVSGSARGGVPGPAGLRGTAVTGFRTSPLGDDNAVERYLRERIPESHRDPRTLRGIVYTDEYRSDSGGTLLGYTQPNASGFATITILRHSEGGLAAPEDIEDTIAHEIGHHVHLFVLGPSQWDAWTLISRKSSGHEFVSEYAMTDEREDFCESYAWYIHYPKDLLTKSPTKYAFMRDTVFAGREYLA